MEAPASAHAGRRRNPTGVTSMERAAIGHIHVRNSTRSVTHACVARKYANREGEHQGGPPGAQLAGGAPAHDTSLRCRAGWPRAARPQRAAPTRPAHPASLAHVDAAKPKVVTAAAT